jgi:hypothetical protein
MMGWNVERGLVTTFRLIGPGRAGRSLMAALDAVGGYQCKGALGRDRPLTGAARGVDLLVIATPDDAVAEVAAKVEPVGTDRRHPPVGLVGARGAGDPPPPWLVAPAGPPPRPPTIGSRRLTVGHHLRRGR